MWSWLGAVSNIETAKHLFDNRNNLIQLVSKLILWKWFRTAPDNRQLRSIRLIPCESWRRQNHRFCRSECSGSS